MPSTSDPADDPDSTAALTSVDHDWLQQHGWDPDDALVQRLIGDETR